MCTVPKAQIIGYLQKIPTLNRQSRYGDIFGKSTTDASRMITEVFISIFTIRAFPAWHALVKSHPIPYLEVLVAIPDFRNDTGQLMPQVRRELAHSLPVQIIFHIRAANRAGFDLDDDPALLALGYFHLHDLRLPGSLKDGFFHFHDASLSTI
jgi:hypothetical protein